MSPSRVNSGVRLKKIVRNLSIKLQKISELQPSLPFTEFDFQQKYLESFKQSELGRIHAQLPLKELAEKSADVFPKKHPQGNKHLFSPEGEVTLMFLKSYTGLSDDGLIELLNGSIHMQLFCGVLIDPQNPIKNGKIVSAIRNRLARCLNIKDLQQFFMTNGLQCLRTRICV